MAGLERRTPTRRPAGAVLARGEPSEPSVSPGQREPQGHAAEGFRTARPASLQRQRCKCRADFSPEVPALLGSRSVPPAPVRTDAAYRAAASWLPALQHPSQRFLWPGHRSRPGWWQGGPWWRFFLLAVHPLAGAAEPEQAQEAERRRPKGAQRPPQDQTAGMAPLLCSPPRRSSASASTTWR